MRVHEGRRRFAVLVVTLSSLALIAAACTSSNPAPPSGAPGSQPDSSAVLGKPNKATGSPIKIGFVDDGKTPGIDHTPLIAAFNATVQYANEYLGGINGHVIEVDECATLNTPSGATQCAVRLTQDGVAAVLVTASAQDANVFNALAGTGITYFTFAAANQDVIVKPGALVLTNPTASVAAPAKIAKEAGYAKAGMIVIDVPAATGPLNTLARPIFEKAGVGLEMVAISPQTADMTPQIQAAIGTGAQLFSVIGTDDFNATAIKALKQLDFQGKIVMVTQPNESMAENIPGGLEGVLYLTAVTGDQSDPDVQLYNAVMQTYAPDAVSSSLSPWAFVNVMAFVRALTGDASAVDAASVAKALGSMPKQIPLPMGGGITYQCGANLVPILANVCSVNFLETTLDAQGKGDSYELVDVSSYIGG